MNPDTNPNQPNQPTQPQGPVEFPTTPVGTGEPLVAVESANIPAPIETPIAVEAVVTDSFSAAPVSPEVLAVAPVDQPPVMGSAPVVAPLAAVAVTSKKKSMTLIAIIVVIVLGVIGFIAFSLLTA